MRIIDPPANESHTTIQIWNVKLSGLIIRGAENSDKVAKWGQNRGILDQGAFLRIFRAGLVEAGILEFQNPDAVGRKVPKTNPGLRRQGLPHNLGYDLVPVRTQAKPKERFKKVERHDLFCKRL